MTDNTDETPDPADTRSRTVPADLPEAMPDEDTAPETDDQADESDSGNKEAAKYRRRLRETEAERDRLTQQVEALQRSEVERQAAAEQIKPAALWSVTELADLLAEDGTVDADKLTAGLKSAREVLGLPAPKRNHVPNEGRTPPGSSRSTPRDDMVNVVMGRGGLD